MLNTIDLEAAAAAAFSRSSSLNMRAKLVFPYVPMMDTRMRKSSRTDDASEKRKLMLFLVRLAAGCQFARAGASKAVNKQPL